MIQNNRIRTQSSEFANTLMLARIEAARECSRVAEYRTNNHPS
jgi:Tfp pilus assembly protein FimT